MSFFRWLSVGLAVVSALLIAGWTALLIRPGWVGGGATYIGTLVAAALPALILAVGHWLLTSAYEAELRRLTSHIESLDEDQAQECPPPRVRFGLDDLAAVVHERVASMRQRLRTLGRQRRELEVQARVAEAERRHLEAILNAITDAVIVTDAFNEIALANESAARVLSFELAGAQRRPIDEVVHDPTLVKLIKDTRAGGRASIRRNVEHRIGHNGQTCVYDVTLACVPGSSGRAGAPAQRGGADGNDRNGRSGGHGAPAAGVVTILRDVTREREIQEMKSDFVSNVSHELRTPLSSIKAYMEMLVDGEAQDEATRTEFYNIIHGETNRLSRLIDNILNISRIESGIIKVQREHISLPQLVREAMDVMQPQARAKRIELVVVPTPVYFQVFADRDMIHQSLLNYIGNAIKYTPEGGQVTVELSVDEHAGLVTVAVSDTGVGIPDEDLPHLFDKFYRVSDHKKLAKGTGLGLNLVKHVVETVHGGQVGATSRLNEGSTFTFSLPIAENV
ncbi:MAG: sensor histidine kinase [Phycisphaeraceae bacterium]